MHALSLIFLLISVSCLAWSDVNKCLVSGSWDHSAKLWINWECLHTMKGHQGPIWAVVFVPCDSSEAVPKILTASADKTIKLWHKDQV